MNKDWKEKYMHDKVTLIDKLINKITNPNWL